MRMSNLPRTDPGGRDAGIKARTGASTIRILFRRIRLRYLKNKKLNFFNDPAAFNQPLYFLCS